MLKRKTGVKARGRGWRGRAWRAVVKVARRTGGRGEPGEWVSLVTEGVKGRW